MPTSVEEVASSSSKKETVKENEAKDPTPALEGSTTKPQLRSISLHDYKETEKEGGRVVPDRTSKLTAPTSSSFQIMEETLIEIQAKDSNRASGKQASETSTAKSHLRGTPLPELKDEDKASESIMQLQQEGLVETKTIKASHKTNIPFHDDSIDAILKERAEESSTSEDVVAATMVADVAPRNSWDLMPSKSRSERLELAADMMMSVTSSVVSQVEGSKSGPSTLSIKDTREHSHEENYAEECSYSRKQSIRPIDNLPIEDSAPSAKETTKGIDENATATYKSPMAIPFMRALDLEDEHKTIESTMQFQHKDLAETKTTTEASQKINTPLGDYRIDVILKERSEQGPTLEDVVVADLKPRNSSNVTSSFVSQVGGLQSDSSTLAYKETKKEVGKAILASSLPATTSLDFESCIESIPKDTAPTQVASMKETHEQGSQGDDATRKAAIAIQLTDSESMKQTRVSSIIAQSLEEIEKEAVRRHISQLPVAPISTNLKVTQDIKDTMEQGPKENYPEDDAMISVRSTNLNSRKQSTVGTIDNLSRQDSAISAKEKAKGVHERATAIHTLPMATPFESECTVEEAGEHSSVQKEAKLEKPIKAILPQVIPSHHYQSQFVHATSSSLKLGICEIFRLVELKHGETALLAQALEQYPQLLLPRANRTDRIIALSYRVLVDILVMLDTKTPNTITQSEKSTFEANLSDAIFLGFDKDWVESVRAKVFGVDMSDVSAAKEKIQVMEMKLREIDSQLLGLSEDRKKLIVNMMFEDIVRTKDKPFGI
ncbi:hypothetical protein QN277_018905 [Acacia crassicarpa]|uniref:Uncharacterized protein n=1 Tax=Acacia crassicarpa TaxID=499986 RepID=A0AAE1JXK4_9FABA|nr:hypothetical protein QN277_018905 [Acacia crassicarpa]